MRATAYHIDKDNSRQLFSQGSFGLTNSGASWPSAVWRLRVITKGSCQKPYLPIMAWESAPSRRELSYTKKCSNFSLAIGRLIKAGLENDSAAQCCRIVDTCSDLIVNGRQNSSPERNLDGENPWCFGVRLGVEFIDTLYGPCRCTPLRGQNDQTYRRFFCRRR